MASKHVFCPSCGFPKNPPDSVRCASCGAKIEELTRSRTRDEEYERRFQQEGVNMPWLFIALGVQTVLTAAIVFGLPQVITKLDFEGGNGMTMCIPVWFVGGMLVGMVSPGRTFVEPMLGSFLVAIPSTALLIQSQTVRTLPTFLYVILAAIGVLFTLVGAYVGERIQVGPSLKPTE
ncbi:MAG: zinc ribbon domain-containing protein [Myxococcales bacterium]